jgi:hypothetical protein
VPFQGEVLSRIHSKGVALGYDAPALRAGTCLVHHLYLPFVAIFVEPAIQKAFPAARLVCLCKLHNSEAEALRISESIHHVALPRVLQK